ncbi:MAG TPA: nitrilase-related carbon-nitrogen hydrolase, partial [Bacteroidales bacterium]|nr:nitrilase-related carbon-nitrogen hydrolase [Bacteroidales bacterium]
MRIALAQLNFHIGDFDNNVWLMINVIRKAKKLPADIVVFPELSVCGYPPRDFLEFPDFIEKSRMAVEAIAAECFDVAAIVGAPSVNPALKGKSLYNSAWFLAGGEIKEVFHKTLLPNYDVFDEYRYFEPNRLPYRLAGYKNYKFAVTICEDLWNMADDPLYVRNPMDELIKLNPDVIINIAASPFHYDQPEIRREIYSRNAATYKLPVFYVNHVGGQTELLFDGASMVIAPDGSVFDVMPFFEEEVKVYNLNDFLYKKSGDGELKTEVGNPEREIRNAKSEMQNPVPGRIPLIHDALVMGIRDYFGKMDFHRAILGLSGGIDSAVTLALAVSALGSENVLAVMLPSRFSSPESTQDAVELAKNLKVPYEIIPIEEGFNT